MSTHDLHRLRTHCDTHGWNLRIEAHRPGTVTIRAYQRMSA